jgi:hypothetical protein
MKTLLALFAVSLLLAAPVAADHHAPADSDKYPLKTCVVSDEELGSMGEDVAYLHKVDGQPDREVRFCCKMCIARFKKDPATYLAKLDAAQGYSHQHSADTADAKACCAEEECAACAAHEG